MPLMRYFVFVGGALLALLLVVNACLPALPIAQSSQPAADLSIIRIHSDRKWPERVVFDTSRPTIIPAPAGVAVVAEAPSPPKIAAAEPANNEARQAFAQLRPGSSELRKGDSKRKRRSVAKTYPGSQRILVAQQPPVLFFGNNVW